MEQAHRILSIYTRLLQQKVVNKYELSNEWGVSSRTIQRDIDNIRNFLYDTDEWHGYRKEITYNHKLESYEMDSSSSNHEVSLYFLLTLLETVSPDIDQHLYNYLELLIATFHTQHESELRSHLSKLKVGKRFDELNHIVTASRAINKSQKLYTDNHQEITPIGIQYYNFTFNLIYKMHDQILSTDLKQKLVTFSPNHFHAQSVYNSIEWVTFELVPELYELIRHRYQHKIIKLVNKKYYVIRIKMCVEDAINFCFTARNQARLVGPESTYQIVMKELLKLQETYLFTRLSANEY
ncbi:helix-turn-helix transcriptional regulator [Staphylococcus simulans]|uniref:helix-turn-helix transcriptional regulator n=1 Tax=Staphylococcus simulans TaxID=1286 RepID=UPI0021D2B754|nr:HTH domain-containing protein [Staphylococcus simulans]UXR45537.1 HTH domain-containing protein [Staphylococcus simulans]